MDYETGLSGAHKNLQSPQVLPVPETLNRHSTAPFPSTAMPAESRIKCARKKPSLASMDSGDIGRPLQPSKRRVMVVADPSRESSIALQWALSHAILEHDELILLHVDASNPSRRGSALSAFLRRPASLGAAGNQQTHHQPALSSASSSSSSSSSGDAGEYDFLEGMRAACEAAHPKVRVQTERVEMEGRDKAAAILSQTKILGVDLLVIGQRRPGSYFLGCKLSGSMTGRGGLDTAEFLIEHCKCLCVGVQKKGQNAGYLLNTKTHKNFWLLA